MRLREVERYEVDWNKVAQYWVWWRLAVNPAMSFCALYRCRTFRISSLIPNVPTTATDSTAHTNDYTVAVHTGPNSTAHTNHCIVAVHTGPNSTAHTNHCTVAVHTGPNSTAHTNDCTVAVHTGPNSTAHTNHCTVAVHTVYHFGVHISIYSEIFTLTSGICVELLSLYSLWK